MGCSRLLRVRSERVKELDTTAMSVIQEVLGSIRVIKAFGQERREYERFVRHSGKRAAGQVKLLILQAGFNMLIGFTIPAGTAAVLYLWLRHGGVGFIDDRS